MTPGRVGHLTAGAVLIAGAVAGCGSSAGSPADAGQMNWGNGNTSTWATFTALHCKQVSRTVTTASVYCSFDESRAPSVGNPDSFWTVYLRRQPDGRWLITNYGQG